MAGNKKQSPRDNPERISSITSIIIAIMGTIATIIVAVLQTPTFNNYLGSVIPSPTPRPSQGTIELLDEINSLRNEVTLLQQHLDSISEVTTDINTAAELAQIKTSIDGLNNRMKVIEQAVLESPEKALSITLLKKDMQALEGKYETNTEVIRDEINRVSGLNQSLIILVMTSMVGLVSLAVANLFQIRRRERSKPDYDSETDNSVTQSNSKNLPAPMPTLKSEQTPTVITENKSNEIQTPSQINAGDRESQQESSKS